MKKLTLLCLTLMICCFLGGGVYIIFSIKSVTEKLERVNSFHRVEFLRESLVHDIKNVQKDLLLQSTENALDIETVVANVETMEASTEICLSCHHSEETKKRLGKLLDEVEIYMGSISRTLTLRANQKRLENAKMLAFSQGERLLEEVSLLSIASAERIGARINQISTDINATNNFLIACVILGPIAIIGITLFFLRRFAGSIHTLVDAAEELKKGNLDYRIDRPLKNEFRTVARAFNSMVTALKEEQQRFSSVHTLYQTLFESAGDAIMITSLESDSLGVIHSANSATCALYGYSCNELVGMNINQLLPENKERQFYESLHTVLQGDWVRDSVKRRRKDGSTVPIDISIGLLELYDRKYLLSFARDISGRLQAEEELQRANQMALVGKMSAGLAHEIKNPLAGIKVSLDLLANELELNPEDQELFARMISEINRMERLLKSLLNYARPPQPQFDLVNINRLLDNTVKNAAMSAGSGREQTITFETDFNPDLQLLEADSAQMQQIFLNILINASEAMPDGGTVRTTTSMQDDDHIRIEITDNGKGLSTSQIEKMFDPFFTTKTKGTGLGLAICRRLVEQHGGTIEAFSEVDEGTSIVIILPLTQTEKGGTV